MGVMWDKNMKEEDGTRVTMKGHYFDWFRDGSGYSYSADRDFDTPMKEDLAIGRVDYWAGGGVSMRNIGKRIAYELAEVMYE